MLELVLPDVEVPEPVVPPPIVRAITGCNGAAIIAIVVARVASFFDSFDIGFCKKIINRRSF